MYCIWLGIGANGKSVFTSLLSALHGLQNVSNVPLASLLDNRFALADLENKDINIDTELSSVVIKDIAILKKLTGRQPIRIERKNQHAYDSSLHAKLLFIANKIPDTNDNSDAHYRREIIISFPNQFEGDKSDVNLIDKLTAAEELSGIFNILMPALRRILHTGRIGINQKTIQERRERHELITNPITAFIKNTVDEFSVESDHVTKEDFYRAYKNFCKYHNLPVEQIETFGKIIKKKHNFKEGRVNR